GPFVQIGRHHTIPVLDIGVLNYIRHRKIDIYPGIEGVSDAVVRFNDKRHEAFDAIITANGYENRLHELIEVDNRRLDDIQKPVNQQKLFGTDGLYTCGFRISPTGQFREIAKEAKAIAKDISRK
ncbi:MAG TPA: hypothetical protein VGC95_08675, partial [Chitinophagaceae bacterium]